MPYPGCAGCSGSMDTFSALTTTSSQELCEAITDAIPGQGWYDDTNGEIGDICAWKTKKLGQHRPVGMVEQGEQVRIARRTARSIEMLVGLQRAAVANTT